MLVFPTPRGPMACPLVVIQAHFPPRERQRSGRDDDDTDHIWRTCSC